MSANRAFVSPDFKIILVYMPRNHATPSMSSSAQLISAIFSRVHWTALSNNSYRESPAKLVRQ